MPRCTAWVCQEHFNWRSFIFTGVKMTKEDLSTLLIPNRTLLRQVNREAVYWRSFTTQKRYTYNVSMFVVTQHWRLWLYSKKANVLYWHAMRVTIYILDYPPPSPPPTPPTTTMLHPFCWKPWQQLAVMTLSCTLSAGYVIRLAAAINVHSSKTYAYIWLLLFQFSHKYWYLQLGYKGCIGRSWHAFSNHF